MGLINEFKRFAMRGNVIDLAVGVVIGTAFGKIVSALVEGVIMPLAGALTRGVDLINRLQAPPPAPAAVPETPREVLLLEEIRDLLKK